MGIGYIWGVEYKCNKCGKVVDRDSNKTWIPSYCSEKGIKARLYKIKKTD